MKTLSQKNKKKDELSVLKDFIKIKKPNYKILKKREAIKEYPNYNGENPDFIVLDKPNKIYTGVELFRMGLDSSRYYKREGYKNLFEWNTKVKKGTLKNKWVKNEDCTEVLDQQIEKKLSKIQNYVTQAVWFIGYLDQPFNFAMLKRIRRNATLDYIRRYYHQKFKNLQVPDKFRELWIFDSFKKEAELIYPTLKMRK